MTTRVKLFPDTYVDSVVQLGAVRAMRQVEGVDWAGAGMATPANVEQLREEGGGDELGEPAADDFFLAVRASRDDLAEEALAAGAKAAFAPTQREETDARPASPRSLHEVVSGGSGANVAVISVPGQYAALAAYQALALDLHVLLFSDNVPVVKEIALKELARDRGLLVMGPGAGTAVLGGVGLGFANVVSRGPVGVVAAAGTGAQEVMSLLDRWGVGVSQVVGVGGRDLSSQVRGRSALAAVGALRHDPDTRLLLLVSKPPAADVVAEVVEAAGELPVVAILLGGGGYVVAGAEVADTLEAGVLAALRALDRTPPDLSAAQGPSMSDILGRTEPSRRLVRGLFSGGSLCYESLVVLSRFLGEVRSNTPLRAEWGLPAPPGSHQCLDLGEEEYTRGRPHPMIDAEARVEPLREHAADPEVAAIIIDVVLGLGAHADPASVLAHECQEVMAAGGPQVVVYVLGTEQDPQGLRAQQEKFLEAGCVVTQTAARASLAAAAIATRRPELVGEVL